MAHQTGMAGAAGFVAAISMAFPPAPAQAVDTAAITPSDASMLFRHDLGGPFNSSRYDAEAETSEWRGRRYGWRRGHRRHRRGIDGGDVLAGVLILGGIAAIASAASNSNDRRYENRRYDDRRYRDRRDVRYDDRRVRTRNTGAGLDNAVDQCLAEIQRDVRVENVSSATRAASGWIVSGRLFNGSGFTCTIDKSGRISGIDYSGFSAVGGAGYGQRDGQWSNDRYADARAQIGSPRYNADGRMVAGQPADVAYRDPTQYDGPLPAYPGGPLPGDE